MLVVSCWDINSPPRFPAGTTRMQVTAMDTADDENTYNAATAHITVPQHSTLTISQRTGIIAVLTSGLDRQGGRQEGPLGGVVHVYLPQLAGTDTGQSEQTLTWNVHQPVEGAPAADWVLLVSTGWRWALSRVALRDRQSTSEMCSQGCPVWSRRKWPLAKLDHILC